MSIFKGSAVAITTPFCESGLNKDTFAKMIDFHLESGTAAIVVCGTTGEPSTMTEAERYETISFAIKHVKGRIPVIAGTGSNNTVRAVNDARFAKEAGADAILVVSPYYNKCSVEGLVKHYHAIADVGAKVIVYNVPGRTGFNITPEALKLISVHENIVAMKEASGNIAQCAEMIRLCPNLDFYSGNDDMVVPLLSLGGVGVISVVANIAPKIMQDMCVSFFAGDIEKAAMLQIESLPITSAMFSTVSPIPVKTAQRLMGYDMGELRLPLCDLNNEQTENLRKLLKRFGII